MLIIFHQNCPSFEKTRVWYNVKLWICFAYITSRKCHSNKTKDWLSNLNILLYPVHQDTQPRNPIFSHFIFVYIWCEYIKVFIPQYPTNGISGTTAKFHFNSTLWPLRYCLDADLLFADVSFLRGPKFSQKLICHFTATWRISPISEDDFLL